MYKYPLTSSQKNIIQTWLSKKDKPLFISGIDGCGKTTLANELLKDYHIVHVNSEHLKYSGDIDIHINNSLLRKDILMMCSDKHYKALLIDDLQLFVQYDKSGLKKLYEFIKKFKYNNNHVIIICNEVNNKYIDLLNKISYNISLHYNTTFYKKLIQNENIHKKTNLKQVIINSKNINTIKLNLQGFHNNSDTKYTIDDVLNILFNTYKNIDDVFTICSSEYSIISLNILENSSYILYNNYISTLYTIYESICIQDYIESKYISYCIDIDILIFFGCVLPHTYLKDNIKLSKLYKFKYNSYIGRSLIQIHNQYLLSKSTINYIQLLYDLYKYYIDPTIDSSNVYKMITLDMFDMKILEKQMKVFNYYYNKIMTKKQLQKILSSIINEKNL
jgi:gluconate kinase